MSQQHLTTRHHPDGLIFKILVQPRSSKNMIAGIHDEALKIKLTAPPVDNAANRMCLKFLAKALNISKSALEIIAGHNSRHKQILLRSDHNNPSADDYKALRQLLKRLGFSITSTAS
jgi:uncharacterized protein (TIGR00251 family)